jgi:hypothetical protein
MWKKNALKRMAVALALLGSALTSANAVEVTPWLRIQALQAGWVVDRMLVFTPGALVNPDGCSIVTNGYIINERDPGRRTFYAMLLSALLNQRQVAFVVGGCFENRPRIVSVSIR